MGLSIGYSLQFNGQDEAEAGYLVEQLRKRATDLPLRELGPIVERVGMQTDPDLEEADFPMRWLLIQASHYVEDGSEFHTVLPSHLIAFSAWIGAGAEVANFGLARYPATFQTPDGRLLSTNMHGWSWSSSCKTQYASNPRVGGIDHFLRVHRTLIDLLDAANELNVLERVCDDGEYWETRDQTKLREKLMAYNRLIAQFAGGTKDFLSQPVEAPIMNYPNFEHLEADAQRKP